MIFPLQPLVDGWRRLNAGHLVRLMLLDIDGCLTAGEASPLNFAVLEQLQRTNRRSAEDPLIPAIALCSGRAEPYVELMTQAIGGFLPAIWENGVGLYLPAEYRFKLHPKLDARRLEAFELARGLMSEALIRPGLARPQPGKEVSISLYPTERSSIDEIYAVARQAALPLAGHYWVQSGLTCVEVLPEGIHKGAGVQWLLTELGLEPGQVLGVGDAPGDLEIFHVTGLGATPANGDASLKTVASFIAPRTSSEGVLDILDWCIERNRMAVA